jgi:hypothetical protein
MSDDASDEGWNPEDEKLEKKFLKKLIELTEMQIKQAGAHQEHARGALAFVTTCEIRPVSNGFIIKYLVVNENRPDPKKPPTSISIPKLVEAFADNINDIIPHVSRAMQSMKAISDISGGSIVV